MDIFETGDSLSAPRRQHRGLACAPAGNERERRPGIVFAQRADARWGAEADEQAAFEQENGVGWVNLGRDSFAGAEHLHVVLGAREGGNERVAGQFLRLFGQFGRCKAGRLLGWAANGGSSPGGKQGLSWISVAVKIFSLAMQILLDKSNVGFIMVL
jgi:hypothetical protein